MKIYDCFTFYNELDLLEMRLEILSNSVDFFVLVEANKTHSGKEKELFFQNNKEGFAKFSEKIIHVIVEDMPEVVKGDRWLLENFQREAVSRGLFSCQDDDLIIISDLDEIENPKQIKEAANRLLLHRHRSDQSYRLYWKIRSWISKIGNYGFLYLLKRLIFHFQVRSNKMIMFKQNIYYYYLNGFVHNHWFGSRAVFYGDFKNYYGRSAQRIRSSLANIQIENGGWHFSYLFDVDGIINKIKSFAHSEYDTKTNTDKTVVQSRVEQGRSILDGENNVIYKEIDDSYPQYILDNKSQFAKYINNNI